MMEIVGYVVTGAGSLYIIWSSIMSWRHSRQLSHHSALINGLAAEIERSANKLKDGNNGYN